MNGTRSRVPGKPASADWLTRMTLGKIDDPVDASFQAWPQEEKNLGDALSELALKFTGLEFGPAKIVQIVKDQFLPGQRFARVEYLFNGVRMQLKILESQIESQAERISAIETKLKSQQFSAAVSAACEEAVRTTNQKKIEQFSLALVRSLNPNEWADASEDIALIIRDIAQLGDRDLKVLGILRSVHSSAISRVPNLNDSDSFSRETPALKRAVAESGIHSDDFLSTCERLRGFGLAAEVLRNTSHMGPNDFCYRPTRRGLAVLDYLSPA